MRKKRTVKKHTVWANVQVVELSKAGSAMEFHIYSGKNKLGTIIIGRGSFTWYGKKKQTGERFSWTRFARIMDEYCYGD